MQTQEQARMISCIHRAHGAQKKHNARILRVSFLAFHNQVSNQILVHASIACVGVGFSAQERGSKHVSKISCLPSHLTSCMPSLLPRFCRIPYVLFAWRQACGNASSAQPSAGGTYSNSRILHLRSRQIQASRQEQI